MTGDTRAEVAERYTVLPRSRLTVWANWVAGLQMADVSAIFTTDPATPIVVERAMYLDAAGQVLGAGHLTAGSPASSGQWFFAEGATGPYFDTFLLLANPAPTDTEVDVTYLLPTGPPITHRYTVPARKRVTVWVDHLDPALANTAVAIVVESREGPVVAERAMWWPGPTPSTWFEGHCGFGSTRSAVQWVVADGAVAGERHGDTYVLVANPGDTAAEVRARLLFEDGTTAERWLTIAPRSRENVNVGADRWYGGVADWDLRFYRGARFAVVIDASAPVVVESSIYWDALDRGGSWSTWAAGTTSLGTPAPIE
jgi:hypothetical protein